MSDVTRWYVDGNLRGSPVDEYGGLGDNVEVWTNVWLGKTVYHRLGDDRTRCGRPTDSMVVVRMETLRRVRECRSCKRRKLYV